MLINAECRGLSINFLKFEVLTFKFPWLIHRDFVYAFNLKQFRN